MKLTPVHLLLLLLLLGEGPLALLLNDVDVVGVDFVGVAILFPVVVEGDSVG